MITIIIWHGNPSSGGTGYHGQGHHHLEAFIDAKQQHVLPYRVFEYYAEAVRCTTKIARIGDAEWSVEVRR